MARRLLAAAAVSAALAVLAYVVAVRTVPGQHWEDWVFEGRKATALWSRRVLAAGVRYLTPVSLVVGTLAVAGVAWRRHRPWLGAAMVAAVAASAAIGSFAKDVVPRPELVELLYATPINTLPSGHAAIGMALVLGAITVSPAGARSWVALVGGALAVVQANGLLASGWHRASDVVVGMAVAVCCTAVATAAVVTWRGASGGPPVAPSAEPPADRPAVAAPGPARPVIGGAIALVVVVVAVRAAPDPRWSLATYLAGVLLCDVVVVALVAMYRVALGDAEPEAVRAVSPPSRPAGPRPARPGTPGS